MKTVSAVICVVNEELAVLPEALASIKGFADEILLVDMTDSSELSEVAKKFDARVVKHDFVNYVEPVRNFGVGEAKGDWILIIDPDEEIPVSLQKRLEKVIESREAHYVRIPRKNIVFGKWLKHSRWWPDYNIRFFKKGHVSWNEIIHTVPVTSGRGMDLEDKEDYAIYHKHYSSVSQFIDRMNRYTTVQAKLEVKAKHEFSWTTMIRRPVSEFLSRYFAGEGYKDGLHGLALSLLQAFSELVLYLKVWEAGKFEAKSPPVGEVIKMMKDVENDVHYWQADTLVKNGAGILQRLRRKFKI